MKRCKPAEKFSADRMMQNTVLSLIRDFQMSLSDPSFCCELQEAVRSCNMAEVRKAVPQVDYASDDVYRFKATHQMANILKRYRYQNDIYSDTELMKLAVDSFMDTQCRLADLDFTNVTANCNVVLTRAAGYISEVLGVYSDEEHRSLCRFGRRASVGVPANRACLAERFEIPISGSSEQISWFDAEMREVESVQNYLHAQQDSDPSRSIYQETSSLKLTLVPKTFKSLRAIMPNTTIGSYMSFGLGEMIRKRLKKEGYDIRSLQMRHRYLARQGSIHSLYTTADLSSASDSITVALVKRLFPPDWLDILIKSRIGCVTLPDGQIVESKTFCTMGIGYTFPLQTLVFLALLKAIESLSWTKYDRRTISVYGDDMIYSPRMHSDVLLYFAECGFVINVDKTFSTGHFRESCGGDYYRGVDVRPFQPRSGLANVDKIVYEAMLYKFINGLLARWTEHEIAGTLKFLTRELEHVTGVCKLVPVHYPDDSGIKCSSLVSLPQYLANVKVSKPKHLGHGLYRFTYLKFTSNTKKECRHEPYLWSALRGGLVVPCFDYGTSHLAYRVGLLCHPLGRLVISSHLLSWLAQQHEYVSPLILKEERPIKTSRSKLSGRRLRQFSTHVMISDIGRYTRQSGTSCFEAVDIAL